MSPSDSFGAPKPLNAVESFEMFIWLQRPYSDVAESLDFNSLSSFERWERMHEYVKRIGYLLGKKNVDALDNVSNESKTKLLLWLEEERQRNRATARPNQPQSDRMLLRKA